MAVLLFEEHSVIIDAAEALVAAVKRTPRIPIDQLTGLRMRLSALVRQHSVTEEEYIYAPLAHDGGFANMPELAPIVQQLMREKAKYSEHIRKWTPQAIQLDWNGYVAGCEERIDALKRTIHEEETRIYQPILKLSAAQMPMRALRR